MKDSTARQRYLHLSTIFTYVSSKRQDVPLIFGRGRYTYEGRVPTLGRDALTLFIGYLH
jgi:hypothetical protein